MKKFLSACTATTLSLSLMGAAIAADPANVAGYTTSAGASECAGVKDDNDRIQCVRERQRQLLKQKMMRAETKMTRKLEKKMMQAEWKDLRVSPRTLRKTVKATKTKAFQRTTAPSSSSSSSAASSAPSSGSSSSGM